jgi:hypothetical protein
MVNTNKIKEYREYDLRLNSSFHKSIRHKTGKTKSKKTIGKDRSSYTAPVNTNVYTLKLFPENQNVQTIMLAHRISLLFLEF